MVTKAQTPAKLFEAMALGKAVIVSDVGDMGNILGNKTGVVIEPDSVDSLVEGIDKVVSDRGFARDIGKNARGLCIRKYSCKVMAEKVQKIYERITR